MDTCPSSPWVNAFVLRKLGPSVHVPLCLAHRGKRTRQGCPRRTYGHFKKSSLYAYDAGVCFPGKKLIHIPLLQAASARTYVPCIMYRGRNTKNSNDKRQHNSGVRSLSLMVSLVRSGGRKKISLQQMKILIFPFPARKPSVNFIRMMLTTVREFIVVQLLAGMVLPSMIRTTRTCLQKQK